MLKRVKKSVISRVRNTAEVVALILIKILGLDSRNIFYKSNGILKFKDHESGEKWFIGHVLPLLLSDVEEPVILDIGANIGKYSIALTKTLPKCRCYSFEPNPITFKQLVANTNLISNVKPVNYGVGNESKRINLFVYKADTSTSHASIYKDVLKECHSQDEDNIEPITCEIKRIDDLVIANIVPEAAIHFIKIDTEGNELEGLKGSLEAITRRGVRAVQFEFNEMNIISRVFLKDFYDLLGDEWLFFRLDTRKLIPLGRQYDSANEVFKFQNIIVIRDSFAQDLCL